MSPDSNDEATPAFPIVAIGASAGGLDALEKLTGRLSHDGMAFVVIQHLAPGHESALTDILQRGATLKVLTIHDNMRAERNHIYVAPPNADLALHRGTFHLMPLPTERRGPRLSIDAFFRSLAADQGPLSIGIILSGAGTDGTLGLKAIKDAGGITFVQEPSTAAQPSMPQNALDAGFADFCLSPTETGEELMRLSKHPYVASARPPKVFEEDIRTKLFILLRSAFGVDFAAYKQSTIERRIQRRMALHRLDRLEDYVKLVQGSVAEMNVLYSDLLIGVTSFFRDKEPFDTLKAQVFPKLLENRDREHPIRIWCAGCSTGEEAFSIAIALLEHLGDDAPNYRIQVFATDIDDQSLARARTAVYSHDIANEVSLERLQRFFTRTDRGYQVNRRVRDMVVFARHNLGKDPPFSRIDIVTCRNVLIYMQPALQRKVLRVFHYSLNPDAYLLLGTSESVGDTSDLFTLLDRKIKLYSKKNIATSVAFDVAFGPRTDAQDTRLRPPELRPAFSVLQLADRKVLEQYGPPGVVVNEKLDILQYRGKTGRFFEPAPGVATINLLKLARPELLVELKPALNKALTDGVRVVSNLVRFWYEKEIVTVQLDVSPLAESIGAGRTFVVLFNEQRPEGVPSETAPTTSPDDAHIQDLERELATTKEYLQSTIEELEAANEELQSSNEELQSSNEELQSTNEELETSKEELQSTNEELVTLNEELQNRMAQLNNTNDDLQNFMVSTDVAIVLVSMDLRIRRFSAAAERLLNLIPADVGRPIAYIRTVMKARDIELTVGNAISAIAPREQRVRSVDGQWYTMRITPYRTADHTIRGAVIEFLKAEPEEHDVTPRELGGLGGTILASLPQGLALLDESMRITWANAAFLRLFNVGADLFGRPLEDIWGGKTSQPEMWKLLESAAIEGEGFEHIATLKPFGDPGDRAMKFSARRLPRDQHHQALTLVAVEEEGHLVG